MGGNDGSLRRLTCPHCQATVGLRQGTTARRFRCPKCDHLLELAARLKGAASERPSQADWVHFVCEVCGTSLTALARQVGQAVECPDCGTRCKVPVADRPKSKIRLKPPQEIYRFQDEESTEESDGVREYAFRCETCDSMVYVRDEQVGTTVQCRDCHAQLVVPARPKPAKKWKPREVATVPIAVSSVAPNTEQVHRAHDLLQEAEQKVDEARRQRPKPPKYPFRTGVLSFPFYPMMLGLWVSLAAVEGIVLRLVDLAIEFAQSGGPMVVMGLLLSGLISVMAIVTLAFAATHLLNILERTADGQNKIEYGPDTTIFGYLFSVITLFVAEAMSVAPGAAIGGLTTVLFAPFLPHVELVTWIPAVISRFLLFPVFLLSLLVNDSQINIYSRTVWSSLRDAPRAWCTFYFCSLPVIGIWAFAQFGLMARPNWALRVPLLAANWILLLYYYRLLGRLIWVLEHQWDKWASKRVLGAAEESSNELLSSERIAGDG